MTERYECLNSQRVDKRSSSEFLLTEELGQAGH